MKANHNTTATATVLPNAVVNISKIQNESKSQQSGKRYLLDGCCCQYFKDTK